MRWIERHWSRVTPVSVMLMPASLVFRALAWLRRAAYRRGILRRTRLPVPVVVLGNITVGGTGKTPLTAWLATALRERGWRPGIVSRGYRGSARKPTRVDADSDPSKVGDEPVWLARQTGVPVWVGRKRAAAARALLATVPDCNVILSDDGLQHYALERDVEIVVVDGSRPWGNGLRLPAGPMRESRFRLVEADAVVTSSGYIRLQGSTPCFTMRMRPTFFRNLKEPGRQEGTDAFRGLRVHAIAGIGRPERFFATLQQMGINAVPHAFSDHHAFKAADLEIPDARAIVMTEKDAIKCERFASARCWALSTELDVEPGLLEVILSALGATHGTQAS